MLGAIAGDVIGSALRISKDGWNDGSLINKESHFRISTILTIAVADSMLENASIEEKLKEYLQLYPTESYGGAFRRWVNNIGGSYGGTENSAALRVSPVAWAFDRLETVIRQAKYSAQITNNDEASIMEAEAIASIIYIARSGGSKKEIKQYVSEVYSYDLNSKTTSINITQQHQFLFLVPDSINSFLLSENFSDAIIKASAFGNDRMILAAAIAEAFYGGIPEVIYEQLMTKLDERMKKIIIRFMSRYNAFPKRAMFPVDKQIKNEVNDRTI